MLGSKLHNRPLFIQGYVNEQKINIILIDDGSTVNILPVKTLKDLGIPMDELMKSRLTIQEFNQGGQRILGNIRLSMLMDEFRSKALFHVIDVRTSYKMLLRRPWIHENGVVSSTLHQCFKYCQNGQVKRVDADSKPFTMAESYFADAKFYDDSKVCKGKSYDSKEADIQPKTTDNEVFTSETPQLIGESSEILKRGVTPSSNTDEEEIVKSLQNLNLLVTSLASSNVQKPPLQGFTKPSQSPVIEHGDLPTRRTNGFDPNAYKLLSKAGYGQENTSKFVGGTMVSFETSKQNAKKPRLV